MKRLTIAIDGYSGCGKSTLAKDLSQSLDYVFIDTGAMYRAVSLFALQNGFVHDGIIDVEGLTARLDIIHIEFKPSSETGENHLFLNGKDVEDAIRRPEIASIVSKVAAIGEVRHKLVVLQQAMGRNGGVVMDGRDIGSVVFPNADLKLFVTADNLVRAQRRLTELESKGIATTLDEVLANLLERDELDINRAESPLIQVSDSLLVDTTNHTRESQLAFVLDVIRERFGK
jgi:CMP/dCMP kinase